jgi:hypothetical protein
MYACRGWARLGQGQAARRAGGKFTSLLFFALIRIFFPTHPKMQPREGGSGRRQACRGGGAAGPWPWPAGGVYVNVGYGGVEIGRGEDVWGGASNNSNMMMM